MTTSNTWVDETFDHSIRFGLAIEQVLFRAQSPFQKIEIVQTKALGKALLLDDLWMTAEGDEATYHEMIVHPALTTIERPERVLIIGGGDGGTAREVLRHSEVRNVVMVEIDGMVVDACKEHLPSIGSAWDDPRLDVQIRDGVDYVKHADVEPFDAILVDGSDPVGPAVGLFDRAFYEGCARLLKPNGVFVTQAESPRLFKQTHLDMVKTIQGVFGHAYPFYHPVMIYASGSWSWIYASRTQNPLQIDEERARRVESWSWVYTSDLHRGAFAQPNHIRRALSGQGDPPERMR